MQNAEQLTREQIREFLDSSRGIEFAGQSRAEVYAWTERVLIAQEFGRLKKKERGLVRVYLGKVTGLSPAQLTRLIRIYLDSGSVREAGYRRHKFTRQYTAANIALLAEVDRAHGRLSGPATRRILEREYQKFGRKEFRRLATISVSHLYNLRRSAGYRKHTAVFQPTRPTPVSIAERRKPDPQGRPGFLRVDTVHQGDWDGAKGVYHINAVDAVTQWQVVGSASKISEQFLIPVLEAMLHQFPFRILGFHADNGSEFINHTVAQLLEKLRIEFTKSRANRSQDQALVEGKNGAVIRKHMGYGHIASQHSQELQKFYTASFNPYLNYHRPCGYATVSLDARGKRQRRYRLDDYATPYEKFRSLSQASQYLKPGITFKQMDAWASAMSDTECAKKMNVARIRLLRRVKSESPIPPSFL
ncbi:MAG: transposase family protein [Bryobacterales bacterium]|nr:transposase family protein [Bryobacterales bacterium]